MFLFIFSLFLIPALSFGLDKNISISVPAASSANSSPSLPVTPSRTSLFHIEMDTNRKSVSVGEAVILTVKLHIEDRARLAKQPNYTKPKFKNFVAIEMKDKASYRTGSIQTKEFRYLLIPKYEGVHTIPGAKVKLGIEDSSKVDMFGNVFGVIWRKIQADPIDLDIKPKTEDVDLVGHFSIETEINSSSVKKGRPVVLNIRIKGYGNLEDFDFPEIDIPGVTSYISDSNVSTYLKDGDVFGDYSVKLSLVGDYNFTIPPIDISVYSPSSGKVSTLSTKSFDITVEGGIKPKSDPAASLSSIKSTQSTRSMLDYDEKENNSSSAGASPLGENSFSPFYSSLFFLLGSVFTLLFIKAKNHPWKNHSRKYQEEEALKILFSKINSSEEIETKARRLYAKRSGDKSIKIDRKLLSDILDSIGNNR